MASVPPISEGGADAGGAGDDAAPGGAFRSTLGRDVHDRLRLHRGTFVGRADGPLQDTRAGRSLGHVARSTTAFSRSVGLSQAARWQLQRATLDGAEGGRVVRPPMDHWPFIETEEIDEPAWDGAVEASTVARSAARPTPMRRRAQRLRRTPATAATADVPVRASTAVTPGVPALADSPAQRPARVDKLDLLRRALAQRSELSGDGTAAAGSPGAPGPAASPTHDTGMISRTPRSASRVDPRIGDDQVQRRGLPIVARRSGRTWAGPDTAPGRTAAESTPSATGAVDLGRIDGSTSRRRTPGRDAVPSAAFAGSPDAGRRSAARAARPSKLDLLREALSNAGMLPGAAPAATDETDPWSGARNDAGGTRPAAPPRSDTRAPSALRRAREHRRRG